LKHIEDMSRFVRELFKIRFPTKRRKTWRWTFWIKKKWQNFHRQNVYKPIFWMFFSDNIVTVQKLNFHGFFHWDY
jgi:hypothetical protein